MNTKKVGRLMDEASLLNHRYSQHMPVKRVVIARVVVRAPNMVWEFDIKYVYVQGEGSDQEVRVQRLRGRKVDT